MVERDKSIIDHLANKGDPHAIAEQRHRDMLYRRAALGDKQSIDQLKAFGFSEAELLANQVLEFDTMGLKVKASEAWQRLKNTFKK